MFSGKPYLTLAIETESVPFDVFVNGGFVSSDRTGMAAHETWPINHLLRGGVNEIGVRVKPWFDEQGAPSPYDAAARVLLRVLVRPADEPHAQEHEVARLQFVAAGLEDGTATRGSSAAGRRDSTRDFASSDTGDVAVQVPRIVTLSSDGERYASMSIDMPLPFLAPAFMSSDVQKTRYQMSDEQALGPYRELYQAYEQVWRALHDRDLDKLMPLFEERSRETDRALFRLLGTTQKQLRESFERTLADPKVALMSLELDEGYWTFDVGPDGRLMRLVWGDRANAVIRFEDKQDSGFATEYPISFRKQGGRYIIAR